MIRFCCPLVFFFITSFIFSQTFSETMDEMKQPNDSVVFMGNSIIQGWGQADPELFTNSKFINKGIGGQTTSQMLARFEKDVIDIRPQAVLILAGTNDIAGNTGEITLEEIRDNIAQMVSMAMNNEIRVILCSVLPAFDYPWRPGRNPDSKIPKLNAMLKELSEKHELFYLDYFSRMRDDRNGLPKEFAEDGVHPTKAGYEVMKKMTQEAFKKTGLTN